MLKMLTVEHDVYAGIEIPGRIISAQYAQGYWKILYDAPIEGGSFMPSFSTIAPPTWGGGTQR